MSYLDDTGKGIRQEAGGILFYCFTAWPKRRQHCIEGLVEEALQLMTKFMSSDVLFG